MVQLFYKSIQFSLTNFSPLISVMVMLNFRDKFIRFANLIIKTLNKLEFAVENENYLNVTI